MLNDKYFHRLITSLSGKFGRLIRSDGLLRAIALVLVIGNVVTTSGMALAKEVYDEMGPDGLIGTEQTSGQENADTEGSQTPSESMNEDETTAGDVSYEEPSPADNSSDEEQIPGEVSSDEETTADETADGDSISATEADNNEETELNENNNITEKSYRGDSYKVNVSYGPETGIPSDAELVVREITSADEYERYCDQISDVYDTDNLSYLRFFDISLIVDGTECEPAEDTTVTVQIIFDEYIADDVSVVHLPDNEETAVMDTDVMSIGDGTAVRFDADGFSAYAIVAESGLQNLEDGWTRLQTVADVGTYANTGIYVRSCNASNGKYHFMSNRETKIDGPRYGVTKTHDVYLSPADAIADDYPAVPFYFEDFTLSADGNSATFKLYCYAADGQTKQYLKESSYKPDYGSIRLVSSSTDATTFTVTLNNNHYNISTVRDGTTYYLNEQGGSGWGSGNGVDGKIKSFSSYSDATNLDLFVYSGYSQDPYGLSGKTYGLLNWNGADNGRLLMASSSNANTLDALPVTIATREGSQNLDKVFITSGDDATMWTFQWAQDNKYYITTNDGGTTKYLTVTSSGLSVSTMPCMLEVIPGRDASTNGQIRIKSGNNVVTFSSRVADGFNVNGTGSSWFNMVEETQISADYKRTYSARKISVSDDGLHTGSQLIVYTRIWNDSTKKYDYYAIDHDGSLVQCYDSGDYLQWSETLINSLLWDLTVYYWEGTSETKENENGYYELRNEYSQKYIAPQITNGQILSDNTIGIQLNGRKNDKYYTPILTWDDPNYAYASLKVDLANNTISSGGYSEAMDFYFASIEDTIMGDDTLHEVDTIDNNKYGIKMKMQDFTNRAAMVAVLGSDNYDNLLRQGILSTSLGTDGYPTTLNGVSLKNLYNNPVDVNHLFIESTHSATGYFEYNSTQNFATLNSNGNFTVYQELGTHEDGVRSTLQHGQFLPYNTITEGHFATQNARNMYNIYARPNSTTLGLLPDSDPRKYEPLYLVDGNPDFCFGMELDTTFIQTPNGMDDWGHDIIYEFTGDDDFWLYVDGELVIDLGGVHSAYGGSVNFATGEVVIDNVHTTLYDIFYNNYLNRDGHTAAEAQAYVDGIFIEKSNGDHVFENYTTHAMRCFYMERGGGGSNLHMRFNQSSVTPGTVILSKEVTGTDKFESVVAQYPYQIWYSAVNQITGLEEWHRLTNDTSVGDIYVLYQGTSTPVEFASTYTISQETYQDVFFLKSGESCEIRFPDRMINYKIIECGVNTNLYQDVSVNGHSIPATQTYADGYNDYGIPADEVRNRTHVAYINDVDPDALRTLTIQKKLYEEDGVTEITADNEDTTFSFRLYMNGEYDPAITDNNKGNYAAYMYPYKIIAPDGTYCRWDIGTQKFVSVGKGPADYATMTDAEKMQITFYTSMNGAISKIPAGYTVEVKGLMIGSHFMVEERDNEIPDGFSRRGYKYFEDAADTTSTDGLDPVSDVLVSGKDPKVVVDNLKGYGIRANKVWTDADYMISHGDTYYAVYTEVGGVNTLVSDVHCISGTKNTPYWYFEHLLAGLSLSDYKVREVKLDGGPISVDSNGVVTGYTQVTRIADNGTIQIPGQMIGDSASTTYTYTVTYDQGTLSQGSNIRNATVTNDRPGIRLFKTKWDGTPLPDAKFTLESQDGVYSKTFTSGSDGLITKAFLRIGVHYFLTENKTPSGYTCPDEPIELWVDSNGDIHADDPSTGDRFGLQSQAGDLIIRNNDCIMTFIKTDDLGNVLPGAHFALHKQVSVGGITMFDFDPITGYEDLVSDSNGIIQGLDNTLPSGTYELRELSAPNGYTALPYNVRFKITDTNKLVLLNNYADVILTETYDGNGVMTYEMQLQNSSNTKKLTITKTVTGNLGSRDLSFPYTLTLTDTLDQPYQGTVIVHYGDGTSQALTLNASGSCSFSLSHGESVYFNLPVNTKYTINENPQGYACYYKIGNGAVQTGNTATGTLTDDTTVAFTNDKSAILPTGINMSLNHVIRIMLALIACVVTVIFIFRRRYLNAQD